MIEPSSDRAVASAVGDELGWTSGSELGLRMSEMPWQRTALGPVAAWPASLRSALSICLGSRFPIAIYWGSELTLLYNDAWSPIPGRKHPWALGRGAREVWPEIWDTIGPMFDQVLTTGVATYAEDSLLLMHRHGYVEECYFNFTFTPIRGPGGVVEGVFNAVIETTYRVLDERRNKALEQLNDGLRYAQGVSGVAHSAIELLAAALDDVPFCALYLADGRGGARLIDARGVRERAILLPRDTEAPEAREWLLKEAQSTGATQVTSVPGVDASGDAARHSAMVVPLPAAMGGASAGVLIVGASPRRSVDDAYRRFAERAAAQIASELTTAAALEAEQQRAEGLAELDRAKTAFFSNVSHELRTPLTLMLGPTEQALAAPERGLAGEALEMVHRNQQRLLRLVNELLEFSRAQAGRAKAQFAPVDLVRVSKEIASAFSGTVEQAGLQLVIEAEALGEHVYLDVGLWERVLLNLLMNAFKFTFEGEIRLQIQRRDGRARVVVADTGIGIEASELPKIFERFHRVPGAKGRSHEGSGIGLSLVRELVTLHHGQIEVESQPGRGSRFIVELPFGKAHLREEQVVEAMAVPVGRARQYVEEAGRWLSPSEAPPPSRAPRSGQRLLVVDDNDDMRAYLARLLREHWHVETARDGETALALLGRTPVDLVITDVMMPGMSGFELLSTLRETSELRDLPVLMLSARAGDEASVEALAAGADDYLVKPFSARELTARVRARLEVATAKKEAMRAVAEHVAARQLLEDAREEAERASRAKDEFLAMLGHELRNPLSPIVSALHLLEAKGHREREHSVIKRQVDHLSRLVDDLLDVSRITRGKTELRRARFELGPVVLRALEMTSPLFTAQKQVVVVDVPSAGLLVDGDSARISQVIANLLTNASKYSAAETRVELTCARVGGRAIVRVRDAGYGIPPDLIERIFDLFFQPPQGSDRSRGGLGLGLAIVRSLVELHGGTVKAESAGLGMGSVFTVELPLAAEEALPSSPAALNEPLVDGVPLPRRVLIVDDNRDAADLLAQVMRQAGYEVSVANTAVEGLEVSKAAAPELCLLDIGLPGMDGLELAQQLRKQLAAAPPLLLAVSGYGQPADVARSRAAGFEAHLVKPVTLEAVERAIRRSRPPGPRI